MVKICLNMIVKNESKIIEETLNNVSKYIDYWVISDTGSTDNTIEVITNKFKELGIPGEIFNDKWEDFGTNRSLAMTHAFNKCDYILVMDADDIIVGDLKFPKNMNMDGYNLRIGKDFVYQRLLLFKSSLKWRYRGVVHEFPECFDKKNVSISSIDGNYYIDSRRLGYRSSNPDKYLHDALTLEKGLEKDPDLRSRYLFYIGQSYMDYGDYEKSLYWYQKRFDEGGWAEETYYSCLKVGFCMQKLKYPENQIIKQYLKTYLVIQKRPEALFDLGTYLLELAINNNDNNVKKTKLESAYIYLKKLNQTSYVKHRDESRLFLNKEIFNWKGAYYLAIVSSMLEKYDETIDLCKQILDSNENRTNNFIYGAVEKLKYDSTKYDEEKITKYPENKIQKLIEINNKGLGKKKIICTMTTCKRLDLFRKTINSFINNCKDIEMIDKWLIIDDNSSPDDREVMKYEYPFVQFVFKNIENKGHSISMNMIRDLTIGYEYVLHLEDDWLFIENTYYIKPALDILESNNFNVLNNNFNPNDIKDKKIVQVLFNKNYSETLSHIVWGGFLMETKSNSQTKFLLHEHYPDNSNNKLGNLANCAYWPHYSFRPSIFVRDIFDKLGPYDSEGFFERKYADKFYSNNYQSCFFDKLTCIHIGKLTNSEGTNAYDLNNVDQHISNGSSLSKTNANKNFIFVPNQDSYGNDILYLSAKSIDVLTGVSLDLDNCVCFNTYGYFKNKLECNLVNLPNTIFNPDGLFINVVRTHGEILCLNLKRRPDRKEQMINEFAKCNVKFIFAEAIDGMELKPNQELIKMFKSNDFGSRKGVIGCALSHLNIWQKLSGDNLKKYYIVMEDDVQLHPKFSDYLSQIQNKLLDLDNWDILFMGLTEQTKKSNPTNHDDDIQIKIVNFDNPNYIGGSFGYIISKSGVEKLISWIGSNGISHGIDYLIKIVPGLNIFQLDKLIVYSDWVRTLNSNVDSDIQKNFEYLDIYSDENFQYIRQLDSCSNDICFASNLSIDEMKKKALENDNCVCFNSLGYFKFKCDELKGSPYFKSISDGVYIKKKYLIKNFNMDENKNEKEKSNKKAIPKPNDNIRIKMICNWTDSKTLCDEWNWMSKGDYRWDNIQITWEDSDIDFYVIINKPKPGDFYIPDKTIIFQMEPQCLNPNQNWGVKTWGEWADPDPEKFLMVRTNKNYLNNVLWQFKLTYNYFKNEKIIKDETKSNVISSICSSKYFDPGHIKRIDFIKFIEEQSDPNVQMHIYNTDNLHGFKSYKGKLTQYDDKHLGIIPYKYYFMCENNSEPNFITEKIWEPIISETLVFYWGCPNISEYINPLAYVQLDMNDFSKSFQIIKESIQNNLWEQRLQYIKEEKEKILDYLNFFPTLKRTLENDLHL
jgi:GR25 family glycosyltransferase involved in LPS biosynthesis